MKEKSRIKRKPALSHDSFFKLFYSNLNLVQELFQFIFSTQEIKACDWKKLKAEKDTFENKRADLVFSVPLKGYPKVRLKIFILLEHKSYYDKDLFDQLLDYQILIRKHNLQHSGRSMPIIPVLFYHGKQPLKWKKTLQEEDFRGYFSKIPVEFRKIMLNYGLKIVDAQAPQVQRSYNDKTFKGRGVIKLLSEIWNIKKPDPSKVKDIFVEFEDILKGLKNKKKNETILKILEYLIDNTGLDFKTWKRAEKLIVEKGILTKGGIMDIREHIKDKGRWEGRKEGLKEGLKEGRQEEKRKVILKMLQKETDISFISEVTGLSEEEILKLKKEKKS